MKVESCLAIDGDRCQPDTGASCWTRVVAVGRARSTAMGSRMARACLLMRLWHDTSRQTAATPAVPPPLHTPLLLRPPPQGLARQHPDRFLARQTGSSTERQARPSDAHPSITTAPTGRAASLRFQACTSVALLNVAAARHAAAAPPRQESTPAERRPSCASSGPRESLSAAAMRSSGPYPTFTARGLVASRGRARARAPDPGGARAWRPAAAAVSRQHRERERLGRRGKAR